ncbi:sulfotransferase domain-containing protein [Deltaproteobacteria bacterium IMCC39524]|nr:sulfotransferase domain-containing protein [Deltaproteobacteria bacterium IMCC39524]
MSAFIEENLQRVSNKTTKLIGSLWGEKFPFWYVCEYPKSGGTWLGQILSDYLRLPFIGHATIFPIGMSSVIHNHWGFNRKLKRCFYLYRDGRDVMVSLYFHRMRAIKTEYDKPFNRAMEKRYKQLYGVGFDPDDIVSNLPIFIQSEFQYPRMARLNWRDHVNAWRAGDGDKVVLLSYEEMHNDPASTLLRCLASFSENQVDQSALDEAITRNSFQAKTKRARGEEDRNSFVRKGIVGDWKNHFNRESAEVFDELAGPLLLDLGYEKNRSWVGTV